MAPSPPAAGLGYNVNACAVVEVDELELPESLGQLCLVGVLEEPELDLEVGVGEAFVAAKAWLTPSAPVMTPAASPIATAARRMVDPTVCSPPPFASVAHEDTTRT